MKVTGNESSTLCCDSWWWR